MADLECAGLTVSLDETLQVAVLRYFPPAGAFADAVREVTDAALPQPLEAVNAPGSQVMLAWRSPTETWCVTPSAARLAQLGARVAAMADGCMVDLTGGLKVLRLAGARIADLLCRLGGTGGVPPPGGARRARLADVPVLALSVRAQETLLIVDRVYLPHLREWIRATLLDLL